MNFLTSARPFVFRRGALDISLFSARTDVINMTLNPAFSENRANKCPTCSFAPAHRNPAC